MRIFSSGIVRYLFRFLLFYWIGFIFPFPLDLFGLPFHLVELDSQPAWMKLAGERFQESYVWISNTKNEVCTWVGDNVLGVSVIIQPTGSGDTMRAYVGCFCAAVIAAVAALLWSAFSPLVRRWKPGWHVDAMLHGFVRVLVRFFLMRMLFSYGFAKVFPLQFSEPNSFRLNQPLGDMSPMGLLWTFMGFSTPYQMFTGAVEVLGGLLLITRRTTPLGALVVIAAMTQVFVLNMCFDVPVKLYSFHYLIMAIFLAAPDLPRMVKMLVLGWPVEAQQFRPLLGSVMFDRVAVVFRTLLVAAMLYSQIHSSYVQWNDRYGGPPAPIRGRWDVVSMRVDDKELEGGAPMLWSWLDFTNKTMLRVAGPKPPNVVYRIKWNSDEKTFTLAKFSVPAWSATFSYDLPQPDTLELRGQLDEKGIVATLKPAPEKHFELVNRGFHWVQEMPYNR